MHRQNGKNAIRLHLGAFNCAVDGWVNTDITPHIWVSRVPLAALILRCVGKLTEERYQEHRAGVFQKLRFLDLTKPLPFADSSVSAVFSSHVFEHLFFDEVERLTKEIYRILMPGGVCRVVVPDLEKIVGLYNPSDPKPFLEAVFEIGRRSDVKNSHHSGFTKLSIRSLFIGAGFEHANVMTYREGQCPDLELLDNRPEDFIFFEATR